MKIKLKQRKKIIIIAAAIIILAGLAFLFKNQIFADVNTGPYTIFQAENFAQVTWDTLPSSGNILTANSTISTFAAQGQTEDISFSVRPNVDLGEVQLSLTDLKLGDKVISKDNIEVLNLKVWDQCVPASANPNGNWIFNCMNSNPSYVGDVYQTKHAFLPELLVKNNEQDLIKDDIGWNDKEYKYTAPTIDQNFRAILLAGKTHTFYLRVKVPKNADAGDYQSTVTFKPGNSVAAQSINLSLKVLPFALPDSKKEILTHNNYRVNDKSAYYAQGGRANLGKEKYEKYLDFLRQQGITGLIVDDYENIDWVAQKMHEKGFTNLIWRPIVEQYTGQLTNDTQGYYTYSDFVNKISQIKAAGYSDAYIYGVDEPNNRPDLIVNNMRYAKLIHQAGAKIANSISKQVFDLNNSANIPQIDMAGVTANEAKIDLPIYNVGTGSSAGLDSQLDGYDSSWRVSIAGGRALNILWPDMQIVNPSTDKTPNAINKLSVAANVWHHIIYTWDGATGTNKIYVDSTDSPYATTNSFLANSRLIKNTGRTFIGGFIDSPTDPARAGILPFKGQLASVKVYNKALSTAEITGGSQTPTANYDFTDGTVGVTGCKIMGGVSTANDGPSTGQKSLSFNGARGSYLDCGKNDNYGITDSLTVETWVKVPDTNQSAENVIISKNEGTTRPTTRIEDYILGIRKKITAKSGQKEYIYNQIWPESGDLALRRAFSGFYLQASGLDGFAPYGLDTPVNSEGPSYYNDFDSNGKAEFAVLPSASGDPVISYQFEAFRTGIDDSRYMALYDTLLAELKAKNPSAANNIDKQIQTMLDQYPYNFNGDNKSFAGQPNSYHQANRKLVADKIVEIQTLLTTPSPTPTPSPSPSPTPTPIPSPYPTPSPTPTPSPSVTASVTGLSNYVINPGYNIIGTKSNVSFEATQLTNNTGLTVQGYNPTTKKWEISPAPYVSRLLRLIKKPQPTLNMISYGNAYYVYNSSKSSKTVAVKTNIGTNQVVYPKLNKDGNFLFNNASITLRLSQIKVDVYNGTTCLAKGVSLEQLATSDYIVKRPYIINDLVSIKTPTLSEVTKPTDAVTSIPAQKGYWIFAKDNISSIATDPKYTTNKCK